jgi:antitoxin component YwqK of YwqJK toxin-antitoxin module
MIVVVIGIMVFNDDESQNRIYKDVYSNIPYDINYDLQTGFYILDKKTNTRIESNDKNIHKIMKDLQSKWIKENLKLEGNKILLYENGKLKKEYIIQNQKQLNEFKKFWFEID